MSLYIAEFDGVLTGRPPMANMPPVAEQKISIGGTSTQSSAFNGKTTYIRVHAAAICSIAVGNNPTATTSNMRMAAGQTEYFVVKAGDKIAVITNT